MDGAVDTVPRGVHSASTHTIAITATSERRLARPRPELIRAPSAVSGTVSRCDTYPRGRLDPRRLYGPGP
jgi:hypothetical protein